MSQLLLMNPSKRGHKRRARSASGRFLKGHKVARRRTRRAKTHHARRAANPIANLLRGRQRRRTRRHNPLHMRRRRRHNPLGGGFLGIVMSQMKDAAIGATGAVAMDYLWGTVKGSLPASIQNTPGQAIGVGDAVKALATVAVGAGLSKVTRGLAHKAAVGALTVQFNTLLRGVLPATITQKLGYMQPAPVVDRQAWLQHPYRRAGAGMGTLIAPGSRSPSLTALMRPGSRSPSLSGMGLYWDASVADDRMLSEATAGVPTK